MAMSLNSRWLLPGRDVRLLLLKWLIALLVPVIGVYPLERRRDGKQYSALVPRSKECGSQYLHRHRYGYPDGSLYGHLLCGSDSSRWLSCRC